VIMKILFLNLIKCKRKWKISLSVSFTRIDGLNENDYEIEIVKVDRWNNMKSKVMTKKPKLVKYIEYLCLSWKGKPKEFSYVLE